MLLLEIRSFHAHLFMVVKTVSCSDKNCSRTTRGWSRTSASCESLWPARAATRCPRPRALCPTTSCWSSSAPPTTSWTCGKRRCCCCAHTWCAKRLWNTRWGNKTASLPVQWCFYWEDEWRPLHLSCVNCCPELCAGGRCEFRPRYAVISRCWQVKRMHSLTSWPLNSLFHPGL